MIRFYFKTNPAALTTEEWAQQVCEAMWIERRQLRNQAELLAALFGGKK
ncbi:MAG: hypothetical protein LBG77_01780 [Dysgonamonadaceae bacterium]|nr:hypothetical protein [Dysgonamonadaceae bacterium]